MFQDTRQLLSEAKFYESYSRFDEELNRYETWEESVDRVMNMHREYYKEKMSPELTKALDFASEIYKNKGILGAQRALQFGGDQLLKHQMKMYNCTSSYCDRPEFFGEAFYIALCGCGVGFSVQKHHIAKLPNVIQRNKSPKIHVVEDSIEGWADALDALLASYFEESPKFPEYKGHRIYFDLTKIRPKGSRISGGFKAPGPDSLRLALDRIEHILQGITLQKKKTKLRPIHAYDILMHAMDAVISGGVRRSATICIFSFDDEEMMSAKTGNWNHTNPQRARSNNSALLVRNEITLEQFQTLFEKTRQFGEPGFIFAEDTETVFNPCVSGNTVLHVKDHDLTENGKVVAVGTYYQITMKSYVENYIPGGLNPMVLSYNFEKKELEYQHVTAAALTRKMADVIKITTDDGKELILTPDHKVYTQNRGWVEAKDLTEQDDIITK